VTDKIVADKDEPTPMQAGDNLTGHFLIAMPTLNDGVFNKAVTYICEHDESGSFGIIINQQTNITLEQIANEMKLETGDNYNRNRPIFLGGPVDQGRGFILHRASGEWKSSLKVNNTVSLTTSQDILKALVHDKGPEDCIVALGYAGWAAGQLDKEIASNIWLSCPADEQLIFDTPVEERRQAAANLIGIDLSMLSSDAGHA